MLKSAIFILAIATAMRENSDESLFRSATLSSHNQNGSGSDGFDDLTVTDEGTVNHPQQQLVITSNFRVGLSDRQVGQTNGSAGQSETSTELWPAHACQEYPIDPIHLWTTQGSTPFLTTCGMQRSYVVQHDAAEQRCIATMGCLQRLLKKDIVTLCSADAQEDEDPDWKTYLAYNMEPLIAAEDGSFQGVAADEGSFLGEVAQATFQRFEGEQSHHPDHFYLLRFEWVPLIVKTGAYLPSDAVAGTFQCKWDEAFTTGKEELMMKYEPGTDEHYVYWAEFGLYAKNNFPAFMHSSANEAHELSTKCETCFPSYREKCTSSDGERVVPGSSTGVVQTFVMYGDNFVEPERTRWQRKHFQGAAAKDKLYDLLKSTLHEKSWTEQMREGVTSEISTGTLYYPKFNYFKIPIPPPEKESLDTAESFAKELAIEITNCE